MLILILITKANNVASDPSDDYDNSNSSTD